MNSNQLKAISITALAAVVLAGVLGFFSMQGAKIEAAREAQVRQIDAERAAEVRQIEREEEAVTQAQKTERTEERSQFWQKAIPWGKDEVEDNSNPVSK